MNDSDSLKRYSKQTLMGEIGGEGQRRLAESSVLVAGCGALGSVVANHLVRAGVGLVRIVDRDFIELSNLARQMLFDEEDIRKGLPKAIAAAEKLRLVNSEVRIEPVVADITPGNVVELMKEVDIVVDGTDNFETPFLLNDASMKLGVPWIYGGVVATGGMSFTIIPGETPCFRCIIGQVPGPGTTVTCDTVGVLGTAVSIIASVESMEAIKLLVGDHESLARKLVYVDAWYGIWESIDLTRGPDPCPACDEHRYEFLDRGTTTRTTTLCGQNAVQVSPPRPQSVSFEHLAQRLRSIGTTNFNNYMLKFKFDQYEFTVFSDGRTIIKGTDDETVAKTLFSKYIGS